jgi:hypothetical protein
MIQSASLYLFSHEFVAVTLVTGTLTPFIRLLASFHILATLLGLLKLPTSATIALSKITLFA